MGKVLCKQKTWEPWGDHIYQAAYRSLRCSVSHVAGSDEIPEGAQVFLAKAHA